MFSCTQQVILTDFREWESQRPQYKFCYDESAFLIENINLLRLVIY